MTPSPDPVEQQLSALQPTPPSAGLARRLAIELTPGAPATEPHRTSPTPPWLHTFSLWCPWGIAAILAVALLARGDREATGDPAPETITAQTPTQTPTNPSTPAPPAFTPVSSTNTLVGAQDEGVVVLDDGRPVRRMRYEYLDTVNLRSTTDAQATVDLTYAREEIRFLPIDAL